MTNISAYPAIIVKLECVFLDSKRISVLNTRNGNKKWIACIG